MDEHLKSSQNSSNTNVVRSFFVRTYKLLRGRWRLLFGFCPQCNSDAPEMYECPICDWKVHQYRKQAITFDGRIIGYRNDRQYWWNRFVQRMNFLERPIK